MGVGGAALNATRATHLLDGHLAGERVGDRRLAAGGRCGRHERRKRRRRGAALQRGQGLRVLRLLLGDVGDPLLLGLDADAQLRPDIIVAVHVVGDGARRHAAACANAPDRAVGVLVDVLRDHLRARVNNPDLAEDAADIGRERASVRGHVRRAEQVLVRQRIEGGAPVARPSRREVEGFEVAIGEGDDLGGHGKIWEWVDVFF